MYDWGQTCIPSKDWWDCENACKVVERHKLTTKKFPYWIFFLIQRVGQIRNASFVS